MTALVRTELAKLRTVRVPWVLLGAALAVSVTTALVVLLGPPEAFGLSGTERLDPLVELLGVPELFAFGAGVVMTAGEYRHHTIRQTLLTTPVRSRILVAKLVAAVPVGLLFAVVVIGSTLAVSVSWLLSDGLAVDLFDGELLLDLAGRAASTTASVLLGVVLAALLRLQSVTVVVYLVWSAFGEPVVNHFLAAATPYLPGEALAALARTSIAAVDPLPMWAAALVVAAHLAVLAVVAARLTLPRDVP